MNHATEGIVRCRRFEGKVALVTGAGQGIGRATVVRLAAEGALVGVLDRNADTASSTVSEIAQTGGNALELVADVADAEAVETGPCREQSVTMGQFTCL